MTGVMALGRKYVKSVGSKVYGTPSTWNHILDLPDASLRVRSMFTQALIGGAEGILFFDATGFDATKYPELNAELDRMEAEFTRGHLASILLCPEANTKRLKVNILKGPTNKILFTRYFSTVRSFNRIQTRLKVQGNTLYLIAANIGGYDENASGEYDGDRTPDTNPSTNGTLTAQFSNLPTDANTLVALFESTAKDAVGNHFRAEVGTDRTIAMNHGAFTDTFGPYETHVYKIKGKLPAGFVLDMDDPTVYMSNYVNSNTVIIKGVVYPSSPVTVNGISATVIGNRYEANITLEEGKSHTISISSSDHTIIHTVGVDATKPDTLNLKKISRGNVFPLTFTWEGSDNLSGADFYSYRINGGKWSLWRTRPYLSITREEWEKLGYSMGNTVVEVRTRDVAFNIDSTPAKLSFTISDN
ncbi:MAG: hypothetical protein KAU90_10430, partial [Sulfurovaceae bacterium]|nr:hypothetical protein [Sulfurovaceae bacterium]